jgi:3-hydroxyisobutyrate dehydrogenase-like beta-hydroxyacid dehydrogenase
MAEDKKITVGIISLGDMGSGLARLLVGHGYPVTTNVEGRRHVHHHALPYSPIVHLTNTLPSEDTLARAREAGATLLPSDEALVAANDIILSVVPPRDAFATAQRILTALTNLPTPRTTPLYFADMNAVSPSSLKAIFSIFAPLPPDTLHFIDGSILGGPPSPLPSTPTSNNEDGTAWKRPLLPTSGPHSVASVSPHLATVLNTKHISPDLGAASGLKMCFASIAKGFAAIAVQAVTTAKRLGVLDELKSALAEISPGNLGRVEKSVVGMVPKA